MALDTQLLALAQRIGSELKAVRTAAGDTNSLATTAKTLVGAINELKTAIASAPSINDGGTSTTSTYSSNKIVAELTTLENKIKNEILGGASSAYDTLLEIQQQLQSDDTDIANLLAALGNRVRFDASQSLNTSQQSQARSNIAAAATAHTHAISEVSGLQNVLDGKSNVGHTHSASDMGAVSATAVGNTDTDFVSAFVSALS